MLPRLLIILANSSMDFIYSHSQKESALFLQANQIDSLKANQRNSWTILDQTSRFLLKWGFLTVGTLITELFVSIVDMLVM